MTDAQKKALALAAATGLGLGLGMAIGSSKGPAAPTDLSSQVEHTPNGTRVGAPPDVKRPLATEIP